MTLIISPKWSRTLRLKFKERSKRPTLSSDSPAHHTQLLTCCHVSCLETIGPSIRSSNSTKLPRLSTTQSSQSLRMVWNLVAMKDYFERTQPLWGRRGSGTIFLERCSLYIAPCVRKTGSQAVKIPQARSLLVFHVIMIQPIDWSGLEIEYDLKLLIGDRGQRGIPRHRPRRAPSSPRAWQPKRKERTAAVEHGVQC